MLSLRPKANQARIVLGSKPTVANRITLASSRPKITSIRKR